MGAVAGPGCGGEGRLGKILLRKVHIILGPPSRGVPSSSHGTRDRQGDGQGDEVGARDRQGDVQGDGVVMCIATHAESGYVHVRSTTNGG